MKILVTGGHLAPALCVIDRILEKSKDVSLIYVGQETFGNKRKSITLEYKEITARHILFYHISAGRFTRVWSFRSVLNLLKTPIGFLQAFLILRQTRPDRILSFGGFIALPIATVAAIFGIPVYTHEQTISPGLANKFIARFATRTYVAFEETLKFFPKGKTVLTGNPVRKRVFSILAKPFDIPAERPIIYVTGGSLGSHSINMIVARVLQKLLKKYTIIHQTGSVKEYDDFQKLSQMKKSLPENLEKHYFLREHFSDSEIGYVFSVSSLVIGRAGANTFFELLALQKPAIFIPLPWSSGAEQEKHGNLFKSLGLGDVFYQTENPLILLKTIDDVLKKKDRIKDNFSKLNNIYKHDASNTIADQLLSKKN